jgi:hypothetical protein
VFISSALREKSGVLFRCNQSHQHASDVFEEFAYQCHMPFKSYQCNRDMNVAQLMQVINGGAMARFWVFFEHLDNLPLVHYQLLVKEIQMVQQQYIIAELGDRDLLSAGNLISQGLHISENKAGAREALALYAETATGIADNTRKQPFLTRSGSLIPAGQVEQQLTAAARPSLGIFGSLSSQILIRNPAVAESLNLQAQATFRTISLVKPDFLLAMRMLLKSEGYLSYKRLAEHTERFIQQFTSKKNEVLYGKQVANSEYIDRVTEKLVLRDIRIAVRFAILLRDQEWSGYRDGRFLLEERQWAFEPQLYEKTLADKEAELSVRETQAEAALEARSRIENETLREGFRNILRTKFFNEWRAAKQEQLTRKVGKGRGKIDDNLAEEELVSLILDTFNDIGQKMEQEEQQNLLTREAVTRAAVGDQASSAASLPLDPGQPGDQAKTSLSVKSPPVRKATHTASTVQLNFAAKREADEAEFLTRIDQAFEKVVGARKLEARDRQRYHCLGVIEHLRRQKAVAIVGPVCSGKTQLLKIVAQTL